MRPAVLTLAVAGACLGLLCACARRDPPSIDASPSVAVPDRPLPAAAGASATASPASAASAVAAPVPSGSSATDVDSSDLPQTRDMPAASGPDFDGRVAALWEAIVTGEPDRALPFFFPLGAYRQVKDVTDPSSDWKRRLVAAYQHDIRELHARLGSNADRAKLVSMEVPEGRARWVDPGEEWNKIGYYRVFGTRLRYEIDGQGRSFDVKSLISWRGQWYVVHLSAIK